jgi:hypothetical protein
MNSWWWRKSGGSVGCGRAARDSLEFNLAAQDGYLVDPSPGRLEVTTIAAEGCRFVAVLEGFQTHAVLGQRAGLVEAHDLERPEVGIGADHGYRDDGIGDAVGQDRGTGRAAQGRDRGKCHVHTAGRVAEVDNYPGAADAWPRLIHVFDDARNMAERYCRGRLCARPRASRYLHLAGRHPI